MQLNDYQDQTKTTALYPTENLSGLIYTVLGVGNEAGELQGKVKKLLRGDKPHLAQAVAFRIHGVSLPTETANMADEVVDNLILELGDVLWYVSEVARVLGVSLETVARYNLAKLAARSEAGTIKGDGDHR